jgi:hypothetical protein
MSLDRTTSYGCTVKVMQPITSSSEMISETDAVLMAGSVTGIGSGKACGKAGIILPSA